MIYTIPSHSRSLLVSYLRSLLRCCAAGRGQQLHAAFLKTGLFLLLRHALFHMYAACGTPASALRAFRDIPPPARSAADWTALISCHTAHRLPSRALLLFRSMLRAVPRTPPDHVSLIAFLSAAARLSLPRAAASAHLLFFKLGLPFTTRARNAVMHVYSKCGLMDDARHLFWETPDPTVVSWTVILAGSLRWEGLTSGRRLFESMPLKNEVAWTLITTAFVEAGLPRNALSYVAEMLFFCHDYGLRGRNLNHITLCSLLSACSQAGDLTVGRWVHAYTLRMNTLLEEDEEEEEDDRLLMVNTALVDMYGKCGRVDTACKLFKSMRQRNVVSWNAMLSVLSMHGLAPQVLLLFSRMVEEEAQKPDDITFVAVLSACSRSGLLEQGRKLFDDMGSVYRLKPKLEHYACMVDLLGRVGRLEEAEALIKDMPLPPNEVVLGSLLASCGLHGKPELGRKLMQDLVQMDPHNTEYHVLLSNLYSSSGRHAEADHLRDKLKMSGVRKAPGISSIEIDGHVHRFYAGDKSHPRTQEVYAMLDEMVWRLRLAGYTPAAASQISRVSDGYLDNGDEKEEREQALLSHSERLAIALGLISTRPGVTLRIFKNLRICSDCHSAIRLLSDIFNREIIVRDRNRFHCFKQGNCSCSDYW